MNPDASDPARCPRCARSVPADHAFCGRCGEELDRAQPCSDELKPDSAPGPPVQEVESSLATLTAWCAEPPADGGWIVVRGSSDSPVGLLVRQLATTWHGVALLVRATPESKQRPFSIIRFVVLAVWRQLSERASPQPRSRAAFAEDLSKLGDAATPYVDVLWLLIQPGLTTEPSPGLHPASREGLTGAGVRTLLSAFAAHAPRTLVVLDGYEDVDPASARLLEVFAQREGGPPLVFLCATHGALPTPSRAERVLAVEPLEASQAQALVLTLPGGDVIPDRVVGSIVAAASGSSLYLREARQLLLAQRALVRDEDGVWRFDAASNLVSWPASAAALTAERIALLDEEVRLFLGVCAIQGNAFLLPVVRAIWDVSELDRDPVSAVLHRLTGKELIRRVYDDQDTVLEFTRPSLHTRFVEQLDSDQRRTFHAATADALRHDAEMRRFVTPGLLARHYAEGGRAALAAQFAVRRAALAQRMHMEDDALRDFQWAIELASSAPQATEESHQAAFAAHRGAATLLLRAEEATAAEAHVNALGTLAEDAGERATADLVRAQLVRDAGDGEAADQILREALRATESAGASAHRAALEVHVELARSCMERSALKEGLAVCAAARGLLGPDDGALALHLDLVEGDLLHAAGQLVEALGMFARAYEGAARDGLLEERAEAANDLGKVRQDMGDLPRARRHYEQRMRYGRRMRADRMVGGALLNISVLSALVGDFDAARAELTDALSIFEALGDTRRVGHVQVNLAYVEIEAGEGAAAVAAATKALQIFEGHHKGLEGHALVTLGEGHAMEGDLDQATQTLEELLTTHDAEEHGEVHALALFALGGVLRRQGDPEAALLRYEEAGALYEKLHRVQETARTRLRMAEALVDLNRRPEAHAQLGLAREYIDAHQTFSDARRLEEVAQLVSSDPVVEADVPLTHAAALADLIKEQEQEPPVE